MFFSEYLWITLMGFDFLMLADPEYCRSMPHAFAWMKAPASLLTTVIFQSKLYRFPVGFLRMSKVCPHTSCKLSPIGSMYAIYGNIYHQYTPNVNIYTIHGSYGSWFSACQISNAQISSWVDRLIDEPGEMVVLSMALVQFQNFQLMIGGSVLTYDWWGPHHSHS